MHHTEYLLDRNRAIWAQFLEHPFVLGMANGDLPIEKFRFYMIQDYLYLKEYVKVFAQGLCHARDESEMRLFAASCAAVVAEIDAVHKPYMQRIGIRRDEYEHAAAALENKSYTAYMLRSACLGDADDALWAILSCSWSYAWIAGQIHERYPAAIQHEFYGDWFKGYLSEEYTSENRALLARVDERAQQLDRERLTGLSGLFYDCTLFERAFWDMAWRGSL